MFRNIFCSSVVASLVTLVGAVSAQAQSTYPGQEIAAAAPAQEGAAPKRMLELSAGAQNLSGGNASWREVNLRGLYGIPSHVFQAELSLNRRFNEDGAFIGLSDTYTFNQDWYGSLAVGAGDGAFYLPRYRADATIYKKWLPNRNLVTSVGVGYYKAPDVYNDKSVSLGAVYYFESPWIVEGGVRLNRSSPGSVETQQQFVAVTYGRDKQDLVIARYGWGSEGYLAVAANSQLVDFDSREASLAWRHWLNQRTGILVSANRYTNPSYRRSGVNVGVFHDF